MILKKIAMRAYNISPHGKLICLVSNVAHLVKVYFHFLQTSHQQFIIHSCAGTVQTPLLLRLRVL